MINDDRDLDLREQLDVLRRNAWLIALLTLLALGVSAGLTLMQEERYTATSRLLIEAPDSDDVDVETESQRVASVAVAELVAGDLGATGDPSSLLNDLSVGPVSDEADVLAVTYTDGDAERAAAFANGFAGAYISLTTEQASSELDEAVSATAELIDDARADLEANIEEIEKARRKGSQARVASLEADRALLVGTLSALQQRQAEVQLTQTANLITGEVLAPATAPSSPSSPDWVQNLVIAGLIGLGLGTLLAFVRARLQEPAGGRSASGRRRPPPPPPA